MRVLLTGAGGQLGRALRLTAPADAVLRALGHAELDIADADAIERAFREFGPEAVINAAAFTRVDAAEEAVPLKLLPAAPGILAIGSAEYPLRAPRPPYSLLDKRPTERLLGVRAPHWRRALRETLGGLAASAASAHAAPPAGRPKGAA